MKANYNKINFHRTTLNKVEMVEPRITRNKSSEQILDIMKKEAYKEKSKVMDFAEAVFNTFADPNDWKNPFYAKFPGCKKEWVKAVIIWFHGSMPEESYAGVYSLGYQC